MSGVETRSRLEQLQALHRRTTHRIDSARRAEDLRELRRLHALRHRVQAAIDAEPPAPEPIVTAPAAHEEPPGNRTDRLLVELGVTSAAVKVWAFKQGLVPAVVRGRIALALVEAYAAAHAGPQDSQPEAPPSDRELSTTP